MDAAEHIDSTGLESTSSERRPLVVDPSISMRRVRMRPLPCALAVGLASVSALSALVAMIFAGSARDDLRVMSWEMAPSVQRQCLVLNATAVLIYCGYMEECWLARTFVIVLGGGENDLRNTEVRTALRYRTEEHSLVWHRSEAEAQAKQFLDGSTVPCYEYVEEPRGVKLSKDEPSCLEDLIWMMVALIAVVVTCGGSLVVLAFLARVHRVWGIEGLNSQGFGSRRCSPTSSCGSESEGSESSL
eukprot:TRINITY_DN42914_c0_g1_i1.p1 TRINITY_DN42914_c0_g1~~TRINITY_DN42914_c0_g1_i1.p1  ORF type:complete len:285 (+),score=30.70 TRINITY_DN42914_c0_g1_i1:123-857(+)